MDKMTATKRILDEKCHTIEQLQSIIDQLKFQHEKKEHELIKHIGILYNDLHQSKKKMAHLIIKYQQQKKVDWICLGDHRIKHLSASRPSEMIPYSLFWAS